MMEVDEDSILRSVADGGAMDYSLWPALLPRIVSRIERIANEEFALSALPPPPPPPIPAPTVIPSSIQPPATEPSSETTENFLSPLPSSPPEPSSISSSQEADKENTPIGPRAAIPPPTSAPATTADTDPLEQPTGLPPQVVAMLNEITSTLTDTFPTHPPHSIQRLSELVVSPKHHYRSLSTYLHALDRVVHVTSGVQIYPLPAATSTPSTTSILINGVTDNVPLAPSPFAIPGSDESLGGALLTPIPWLQGMATSQSSPAQSQPQSQPAVSDSSPAAGVAGNGGSDLEGEVRTESTETIDGPNGMGSIETVSVSVNGIPSMGARGVGVTQGELLRQEQRAGVVPVSQLVPSHHVVAHHNNGNNNSSSQGAASAQQQQQQHHLIQQIHQHQHQHQNLQSRSNSNVHSSSARTTPESSSSSTSATLQMSPSEGGGDENTAPSSATLTPDAVPNDEAVAVANASAQSAGNVFDDEDDRPHARGPEEIGADDLGPQHPTTSATTLIGGPGGVEMQGIDISAAVGRKPDNVPEAKISSPAGNADEGGSAAGEAAKPTTTTTPGDEDEDKMDIVVDEEEGEPKKDREKKEGEGEGEGEGDLDRVPTTPKREAEDPLEGGVSKKLKEDTTTPSAEQQTKEGDATTIAKDGEKAVGNAEEENKKGDP